MKNRGQSLIEFAVVVPLLIALIFCIIEFSMYWRAVNTVQEIAQNASTKMSSIFVPENSTSNPAVDKAVLLIADESGNLGENINFEDKSTPSELASRPFAVYTYESQEKRNTAKGIKPVMTVTINYKNPSKNGIIMQLSYQYRTILVGAEIPLIGNKSVIIIPRDIEIVSKKTQQCSNY